MSKLQTKTLASAMVSLALTAGLTSAWAADNAANNKGKGLTKPSELKQVAQNKRYIISFYHNRSLNNLDQVHDLKFETPKNERIFVNGEFQMANAVRTVESLGGQIIHQLHSVNAVAAMLSESEFEAVRGNPEVYIVEEDPLRYIHGESSPYGIASVQADVLSDANIANRKVCVIDTGMDTGHEDLQGLTVTGEVSNTLNTAVNLTTWDDDSYGHGTHVTGILAAVGSNNVGVRGVSDSGNMNLHIVKVIHNPNYWSLYGSDMIAAVNACQTAGANIINMSIGGESSSVTEQSAMDIAASNDIMLFAAAGNRGSTSYFYPASYDSVVSVGAVDANNNAWTYSQANNKVELAAPGVGIESTQPNNQYRTWDGTSMATPYAAGVAALVWSHHDTCSANQVRQALTQTATDLGDAGRDDAYGFGLVQAQAASDYLTTEGCPDENPPPPPVVVFDDPEELDEGNNVNTEVNEDGEVVIQPEPAAFDVIWVAASGRGTIVKIDTETGDILGEYYTSPAGLSRNPSRTTVDGNGNVWATNRADSGGGKGSVVHIGAAENEQCVDRNNNGVIETSTGLGDIKPWTNSNGADTNGGVSTAADECIIHFTKVRSTGTRHVSVTTDNNVWVSGTGGRYFDLVDGETGQVIREEPSVGFGGYGGLIDKNGVIWSSANLMRWDTSLPLTGEDGGNWRSFNHPSYGLCIDSQNNIWVTEYGSKIHKYREDGTLLGTFTHGASRAQGCAVDQNDHVWVAHSLGAYTTIGHLTKNGDLVGVVGLQGGSGPTGVAIDKNNKVWVTNYRSHTVSRIDSSLGALGIYQIPIGAVDMTVTLGGGASPYNYSDMTGSVQPVVPGSGTFSLNYDKGPDVPAAANDSLMVDRDTTVTWDATLPGNSKITVTATSSDDGVNFGQRETVTNGQKLTVATDRHLRLYFHMERSTTTFDENGVGDSPAIRSVSITRTDPVQNCGKGQSSCNNQITSAAAE